MRIITLLIIALLGAASARSSRGPTSGGGSAPRRSSSGNRSSSGRKGSNSSRGSSSLSRRPSPPQRNPIDEYDEDPLGFSDDDGDGDDDGDEYDDDYDVVAPASRGSRGGNNNNRPSQSQQQQQPQPRFDEYDDDEYDDDYPPSSRRRSGGGGGRRNDDYDDDYRRPPSSGRRGPPPSSSSRGGRGRGGPPPSSSRGSGGRVVPYGPPGRRGGRRGPPPPSTLSRYTSAIREKMPDPTTVKDTMFSAASATKERTSQLSSNIYREVKGLTSSELEQVMLKSTRPDDTPVKSKHVERLVGVTYQISGKYDIYDAVLRKLWNKMAEKDMRTKLKSVYVLHRFAVDGGPDHQEALKQRLRALRKTKDPKRSSGGGGGGRGGTRYFDSKVLIGVDNDPETAGYRAFLSRYAHYVLTRAQTFGGVFNEISLTSVPSSSPPSSKKGRKSKGGGSGGSSASKNQPKNPPLCEEHLKFAQMVLKAGLACTLHDGEDSESTAMCVERVAADLMGLTAAVAVALKRELKQQQQSSSSSSSSTSKDSEEELVKQWCEFYADELLPETKKFCKKVTNKLDTYGLYLPSRISSSLSPELLEKGLKLGGGGGGGSAAAGGEEKEEADGGGATAEEDASDEEEEAENTDKGETDATADDDGGASMAMSASASTPDDDDDEYDYDYDYDDDYD